MGNEQQGGSRLRGVLRDGGPPPKLYGASRFSKKVTAPEEAISVHVERASDGQLFEELLQSHRSVCPAFSSHRTSHVIPVHNVILFSFTTILSVCKQSVAF